MMINDMESKIIVKNVQRIKSFVRTSSLLALTLIAMLLVVGCGGGGGLTTEQLLELEETKAAALSAEDKIQERKVARKTLSDDLTEKKKELKQLLTEKEVLTKRQKDIENLNKDEMKSDTGDVDVKSEDNGDGS